MKYERELTRGRIRHRRAVEIIAKIAMIGSTTLVVGSLLAIIGAIVWKSLPALKLSMITQTPKGGYYLGKEGGVVFTFGNNF